MNRCIFTGWFAADPETRFSQNGDTAITRFRLVVKRRIKREGEKDADFLSFVSFGKNAENIGKYFQKGSQILVDNHGDELWISTKIGRRTARGENIITSNSSTFAAIYCAYRYGIHEDELRRFVTVCQTGIQDEAWQTPAVLLRNYYLNLAANGSLSSHNSRRNMFLVASQAIYDYHCHKRRKMRYQPEKIDDTVITKYVVETDAEEVNRIANG